MPGAGGPPLLPKLLRVLLLQYLYSVRSGRLLMGQLDYNLLFRRLVGLNMDNPFGTARGFRRTGSGCSNTGKQFRATPALPILQDAPQSLVVDKVVYTRGTWKAKWRILCGFCQEYGRKAAPV